MVWFKYFKDHEISENAQKLKVTKEKSLNLIV